MIKNCLGTEKQGTTFSTKHYHVIDHNIVSGNTDSRRHFLRFSYTSTVLLNEYHNDEVYKYTLTSL